MLLNLRVFDTIHLKILRAKSSFLAKVPKKNEKKYFQRSLSIIDDSLCTCELKNLIHKMIGFMRESQIIYETPVLFSNNFHKFACF